MLPWDPELGVHQAFYCESAMALSAAAAPKPSFAQFFTPTPSDPGTGVLWAVRPPQRGHADHGLPHFPTSSAALSPVSRQSTLTYIITPPNLVGACHGPSGCRRMNRGEALCPGKWRGREWLRSPPSPAPTCLCCSLGELTNQDSFCKAEGKPSGNDGIGVLCKNGEGPHARRTDASGGGRQGLLDPIGQTRPRSTHRVCRLCPRSPQLPSPRWMLGCCLMKSWVWPGPAAALSPMGWSAGWVSMLGTGLVTRVSTAGPALLAQTLGDQEST